MPEPTARLLASWAIAGALLAGCAAHRESIADTATADSASLEVSAPAAPPPPPAPAASGESLAAAPSAAKRDAGAASAMFARATAARERRASARPEAEALAITGSSVSPAQAQSGVLTAGDYDDLLNPAQYARYAERYLQGRAGATSPFVDTRTALKVRVVGHDGEPVAFAEVWVVDTDGQRLRLHTAANGVAVLFPGLDRLPRRVALEVGADGAAATRRSLDLARLPGDSTVTVELPVAGRAPAALDLLLAIDTTGSMGDELGYLQAELDDIVASLRRIRPGTDIRVGLVVYRDHGDEYVTRRFEFTGDLAGLRQRLGAQQASGGGDYPEAVDAAFDEAARFDWRRRATKVLLHVADAPPHADRADAAWQQAMALRMRGVHIVPVAASGVAEDAQYLMRSMAAVTQGRYLFLTDDSGVGLPHAEPDVPCYVVTRLDGLIGRVLASLLVGHRVEPQPDAIVRRSGNYDRGVCQATRQPRIAN